MRFDGPKCRRILPTKRWHDKCVKNDVDFFVELSCGLKTNGWNLKESKKTSQSPFQKSQPFSNHQVFCWACCFSNDKDMSIYSCFVCQRPPMQLLPNAFGILRGRQDLHIVLASNGSPVEGVGRFFEQPIRGKLIQLVGTRRNLWGLDLH